MATLAEDGDVGPLAEALAGSSEVLDIAAADGVLMPGESVTLEVQTSGAASYITVLGMLVTTNDAFFAVNSHEVFGGYAIKNRVGGVQNPVAYAHAYDAGTEANTESCEHIPGPPCGNGGVRVTDGAEGYVYISNGIHGTGDIDASAYDWRGPVAKVTFYRIAN